MKYSNIIAKWLVELGYTHCFYVAGGGIMHLLDGFRNEFECIPVVHEVSAGICAEHFNQCSNKNQRAFALVTTGPGLTNIVTAIAGCYVEHRELLVISGQVKSTDLLTYPERQRGVQEVDGNAICAPISVKSACLTSPIKRSEFVKLVELSQGPHPGPVVIEICLDIQGAKVIPELLNDKSTHANSTVTIPTNEADIDYIVSLLMKASRPIILLGGLVSREIAWQALPMLERLGVPVATTTSAIDRIPSSSLIFAGRPGTWGGQRAANLVLAQADFILVLGAQLDLQQTGFNYTEYATTVNLIHVFPSEVELKRTGPTKLRGILASPDLVLVDLMEKAVWVDNESWNQYVKNIQELVPSIEAANTCDPEYVNSFIFLKNLSKASNPLDVLALCSSGGTFTGSLQNYEIATHQIATTSAAHASMGYGLATAIGAAFANPNQSVILTEGEGGFSQNLQELALIKRFNLPIKIFLFDNNGYASIRATQKKFFNGAYLGCDSATGLGFPDWLKLFAAYDIPSSYLSQNHNTPDEIKKLLAESKGPQAWIVRSDPNQPNWPAVSTILSPDGSLKSSPLYDMLPKLSTEIYLQVSRYLPCL